MPKTCSQCPAAAERGKSRCRPCLDAMAAYMRARVAARVCRRCKTGKPKPGRQMCPACSRKAADHTWLKRLAKPAGVCKSAGCDEPCGDRTRCPFHNAKYAEYSRNCRLRPAALKAA